MARHHSDNDSTSPVLKVLYFIVFVGLIAALVFMYRNYRNRKNEYKALVRQAAQDEMAYDIESRKDNGEIQDEIAETAAPEPETTEAPEPTAEPAQEPTQEPEHESDQESEPAETDAPSESDELMDESLAAGIDG